ncbi:MAG TPA: hypothetical protein PLL00_12110 [Bacteroidia bacterium]|jgi:hypothetical protein|nr:hypothetical protein [Bacteroidia bacterium]
MELKRVADKTLLYDNLSATFYQDYSINLNGGELLTFSPIAISRLKSLEKSNPPDLLNAILQNCKDIHRREISVDLVNYKNAEDLTVYYIDNEKYVIIISMGEINYGRTVMFLEGVFEKR